MMTLAMTSMQASNESHLMKEGERDIFSPSSYEVTNNVDQEKLWRKIVETMKNVLQSEFSIEEKRELKMHRDRVSFACIYCGDSFKDTRKKRGNLFQLSMQYHCFNGDCNAHMSIYNFIKERKLLNNFTLDEQNYMREAGKQRFFDLKKIRESMGLETFFSEQIEKLSVERSFLMEKLKLVEIKGSRIEKYLKERLQTNFHKFGWNPKEGLLYVFNYTADEKRVIGLQIKTFNKRNPYLTWKLSRIHEELGIYREEHREDLEKMDFLSNIFGIFQADLNRPITVFEGPLDSFLFPNSVALCSAKNSLPFEVEGARYFYDNDATGRDWAVKRITQGNSVFLWRKFIEENELSAFQHKIKDLNDLLVFIHRSRKRCKKFIDYFSSDKYDMVFI
jgi:hypothetical protein